MWTFLCKRKPAPVSTLTPFHQYGLAKNSLPWPLVHTVYYHRPSHLDNQNNIRLQRPGPDHRILCLRHCCVDCALSPDN